MTRTVTMTTGEASDIDIDADSVPSPPPSRGARVWRAIDGAVWAVAILGAVALALLVHLGGFQVTRVLSPSMVPTFSPGDLLVIRSVDTMDLHVGDIPVLPDPDEPQFQYVHRIISAQRSADGLQVVTQGDANPASDTPVTVLTAKVPEVVFSVPLGRFNLASLTLSWTTWLLGGAVVVFLALLLVPGRRKAPKD
jgi:signal peptidase I